MFVYTFGLALSCTLCWGAERRSAIRPLTKSNSPSVWLLAVLSMFPLTILSAVRWGVGTDFFFTYLPQFQYLKWVRMGGGEALADTLFSPLLPCLERWNVATTSMEAVSYYEYVLSITSPAYRAIMELVVFWGGNFRWVEAITSLLIGFCVGVCIFTQSSRPTFALYLYVTSSSYFLALNITRQYLAIGICLLALPYLWKRKFLPFLLLILLATLFHDTALILLPCYFLCRIPLRPLWCALLILGVLLTSPLFRIAMIQILFWLGKEHYQSYFSSAFAADGFETMYFLVNTAFLLVGAVYWEQARQKSPAFLVWYNLTVLGTLALALSGQIPLMKRINYYLAAPQFLLLPETLEAEENPRRRRIFTGVAVVLFAFEYIIAVGLLNKNGCLPYHALEWYES